MATIVLVHGAWQGAWCWERLQPILEGQGHKVITPTLAGSGDRAQELTATTTLETHITDVLDALPTDARDEVVLVGHSYSGMVISGVAEQAGDRIMSLVFVDAFYPNDGESALDQMPEPLREMLQASAAESGEGWRLPPSPGLLDIWGLRKQADREWVGPRLTEWSLNCFASPLHAPEMRRAALRRVYVAAAADAYPGRSTFEPIANRASAEGSEIVSIESGHDVMIEAPAPLAEAILAAAH
jgi:pimeloyl-ACP methyl ester carboxylesterase